MVRTVGNVVLIPTVLVAMMMGGSADSSPPSENGETLSILASDGNDWQKEENDNEFLHHLWEGFVLSEALKPSAVLQFLKLGLPGM